MGEKREEKKGGKKSQTSLHGKIFISEFRGVKVKAGNLFKVRWMFTTDSWRDGLLHRDAVSWGSSQFFQIVWFSPNRLLCTDRDIFIQALVIMNNWKNKDHDQLSDLYTFILESLLCTMYQVADGSKEKCFFRPYCFFFWLQYLKRPLKKHSSAILFLMMFYDMTVWETIWRIWSILDRF